MAQQTLTHTGSITGYQAVGDEVRADAGQPKAVSAMDGPQFRQPFSSPQPLGSPPDQDRPEPPEPDDDHGQADHGQADDDGSWSWTASAGTPGPAYGGALYNGGGELANVISGTKPLAIESAAPKVIAGTIEAADV
jgi:hypothetical protein